MIEKIIDGYDKYAVFELKKKTIVIITQGDPNSNQGECLNDAVKENADIIVCASRTRGDTKDCIYDTAKNGYGIIWFSNFHVDENNSSYINHLSEITAEAIKKLIITLIK